MPERRYTRYSPEQKEMVRRRYIAGMSTKQNAEETGVSPAMIRKWKQTERWLQPNRGHPEAVRDRARDLYESGLSIRAVAERVDLPPTTIDQWARKEGWKRVNPLAQSREELLRAIRRLSTQKILSGEDSRALEKLTKSLERLDKAAAAERRAQPTKKAAKTKNAATREALLAQVLAPEFGLYPYQRAFLEKDGRFRAVLKARQIGFSYVLALDALLEAAGGRDAVIVSASQDQADLLIGYAQRHADRLGLEPLALSRSELVLDNGARIVSRPANVRTVQGFSGSLYLDEFAWMQDARKMWEAAVPVIVAVKGRLTVCSTPYDQGSLFYQLIEDPDRRYSQFSRVRITLSEAVAQGLPVDEAELRGLFDADAYARLFDNAWFDDAESYFTFQEVQACTGDCLNVTTDAPLYGGYDVGRTTDASELMLIEAGDAVKVRLRKTLKRAPFAEQKAVLESHVRAYRVKQLHIDATGMGANLAEDLQRSYPGIVRPVWFTQALKEELAVNLKKLFEERKIVIPNDPNLIAQIHGIKRKAKAQGFSYDSGRNKEIGHADAFWALALACRELGFGARNIVKAILI